MIKQSLLMFMIVLSSSLSYANEVDCNIKKYKLYADAKEKWQRDLADLIISTNQNYKDVALLYRDDQLNFIERDRIGVDFMLNTFPEKVKTQDNLNQWIDFSDEDEAKIKKADDRYANLSKMIEAARHREPEPDGDSLRTFLRGAFGSSKEFKTVLEEFQIAIEGASQIVCKD